jgi:D-alanyl-D-alanine endopeptidase (penicillin-binding protein 7)
MRQLLLALSLAIAFSNPAEARTHRRAHAARHPVPAVAAFSTKSFLIAGPDGQIFKEQDSETVRPIASISKLMVALLASEQPMDEELQIPHVRTVQSVIPKNTPNLTRKELLTFALIKSDNFAAQILCENLPNCVERMNSKAQELGMVNTHYEEPTGLSKANVSTAQDLLKLLMVASDCDVIKELSHLPEAEVPVGNRVVKIKNTNPLTSTLNIVLSKTGFTNPAGGCLVMIADSAIGRRIYVLLGSKNAHTRIPDMKELVKESD